MKSTFATLMPDKIGAFLKADKCITDLGLNITRVSYNKAVDTHMLFLEVEGEEEKLKECEKELTQLGYMGNTNFGDVILMEFRLKDEPGALLPVLELINNYKFNISYISSNENGSGYQDFKMGLYIDNENEIADFVSKAVRLCHVKILEYSKSKKVLDNTAFYLSFANEISKKVGFSEAEKTELIINSNKIMQILDEKNLPPYKTFDYIGKFSEHLYKYKNENYKPRISKILINDDLSLLIIEPPCGSNICVFIKKDMLIFIDSGFNLYKEEALNTLKSHIEDFDIKRKEIMLTHSDVDHIGFLDYFSKVYLSCNAATNLKNILSGKDGYREENPLHSPYVKISKLLSKFTYPSCKNFSIIGEKKDAELLSFIGKVVFDDLTFEAYEGSGGHVKGETIYIEREKKLVFTGDLYVNVKGFTDEQAKFNKLAPYLMTSVDTDPSLATVVRKQIKPLLDTGKWTIIGGHGAPTEWDVD